MKINKTKHDTVTLVWKHVCVFNILCIQTGVPVLSWTVLFILIVSKQQRYG